jgi:hypothetical protein
MRKPTRIEWLTLKVRQYESLLFGSRNIFTRIRVEHKLERYKHALRKTALIHAPHCLCNTSEALMCNCGLDDIRPQCKTT